MSLKRLVVNADGLGRSAGVNRGAIEAHRRGIVTSATLAVNYAGAAEVPGLAQDAPGLGIGLQLTFTGGPPVAPPERIASLVDFQGRLPHGVDGLDAVQPEDLLVEARAQLRRFHELMGREPTHLDTRDLTHRRADVLEALLTLAWETGLPVRNASPAVHERLQREGVRTTDHFTAEFQGEAATVEGLVKILSVLPIGTSELACRPALVDDELRAADPAEAAVRGRMLDALTHREARQTLQAAGVRLIHFGEL